MHIYNIYNMNIYIHMNVDIDIYMLYIKRDLPKSTQISYKFS